MKPVTDYYYSSIKIPNDITLDSTINNDWIVRVQLHQLYGCPDRLACEDCNWNESKWQRFKRLCKLWIRTQK